jgi:uncharacterized protein (DUF927 family)
VRLLNLPGDAGAGFGVFQDLHGAPDAGAFADGLRKAAVTYYGTAGPAFLGALVRERANDGARLAANLKRARDQSLKKWVPKDSNSQVRTAAVRFSLIGTAGELARAYGVLPWPKGEALRAARACFTSWLAARGGHGSAEAAQVLEMLELFLAQHGASRFESLKRGPDEQKVINRAGFVQEITAGQQFLIFPSVWRGEIFKGMDAAAAARTASTAGYLTPGSDGKMSRLVRIPGHGPTRLYVISGRILGRDKAVTP